MNPVPEHSRRAGVSNLNRGKASGSGLNHRIIIKSPPLTNRLP
jgi:hypothetical protein